MTPPYIETDFGVLSSIALDRLPAFVSVQANDHSIKFGNRIFRSRFGNYRDKRCYEIYHNRDEPCNNCISEKVIKTGIPVRYEWTNQFNSVYDVTYQPFGEIGKDELVLKLGVDITGIKKAAEETIRKRMFDSLEQLVGGVAHDFNNILTSVIGNISLGKKYTKPEGKVFALLQDAEISSLAASDLVNKLILFAKGEELSRRPVKMSVETALWLKDAVLSALHSPNTLCEFLINEDIKSVVVDREQLDLVISNLVRNACDAMPGGGKITVRACNVLSPSDGLPQLRAGKYVKITVRDQGAGIPKEYLSRIFEPYFTTANRGGKRGQGLGLALCHSIVKHHGGNITATSDSNGGTAIEFYLPAAV